MKDGRGQYAVEKMLKLRKEIAAFVVDNADATKGDIKHKFGISYTTVRAHLAAIEAGK